MLGLMFMLRKIDCTLARLISSPMEEDAVPLSMPPMVLMLLIRTLFISAFSMTPVARITGIRKIAR